MDNYTIEISSAGEKILKNYRISYEALIVFQVNFGSPRY